MRCFWAGRAHWDGAPKTPRSLQASPEQSCGQALPPVPLELALELELPKRPIPPELELALDLQSNENRLDIPASCGGEAAMLSSGPWLEARGFFTFFVGPELS